MRTFGVVVGAGGEITLPPDLLDMWRLKTGDNIELFLDHRGLWNVRPLNASPAAFYENRRPKARLRDLSDDQAIAEAVARRSDNARTPAAAA